MNSNLTPLLEIALRHVKPNVATTAIPRLELRVGLEPGVSPCLYRSMVCFVLQGSKEVAIGAQVLRYGASRYLISALDLPLMGQVHGESRQRPYVGLNLVLDPAVINELIAAMPASREPEANTLALSTTPMTGEIVDVLHRLLALLDRPDEIPALAPLLERELLFRLLQGPNGQLLRQIASPKGPLAQVRHAMRWISENFDQPITIDDLCHACGMSRASLHRSFRVITGQSPLQYQKQLRLLEARRLLMAGEHNTSTVAFAVGYESLSQFSREYLRQFDTNPSKDMPRRQREAVPA